ncbi:MAG: hypothetical protein U0R64_07860 [Candidatus Nanopelagicales bacterium]
MDLRTPAALAVSSVLLFGGVAACSSSTSTPSESASSATPTAAATPNGVQKQDADQILEPAKTAAKSAKAAPRLPSRPTATARGPGHRPVDRSGRCAGRPPRPFDGATVEVVSTKDMIYVKGDAFAQSLGTEAAAQVQGKWVGIPMDNPAAQSFTGLNSIEGFVDSVLSTPKGLKKGQEKDIDGTWRSRWPATRAILRVATTGEPYPCRSMLPKARRAP